MRVAVRLGHAVGEGKARARGRVVGMRMVAGYDCL